MGIKIIRTTPLPDIGGSTINTIGETLIKVAQTRPPEIRIGKTR
jgi:hypothetical protein